MRKDDQWFEPGDKVMRVSNNTGGGAIKDGSGLAPFGKVFCVVDCCGSEHGNLINFAGILLPKNHGFRAANFRKVEEIQLCVRAAEAMKTPKKQEELV